MHPLSLSQFFARQVDQKNGTLSQLRTKIQGLKEDFDQRLQREVERRVTLTAEEMQGQAKAESDAIHRQNTGASLSLRQANAQLHKEKELLLQELKQVKEERFTVRATLHEVNDHYTRLYEESKAIMYESERMQHDLLAAKAKMEEYQRQEQAWVADDSVVQELAEAKRENARLQSMWLTSQKEACELKETCARAKEEAQVLQVGGERGERRLGISLARGGGGTSPRTPRTHTRPIAPPPRKIPTIRRGWLLLRPSRSRPTPPLSSCGRRPSRT
jgi:hypothetical protein